MAAHRDGAVDIAIMMGTQSHTGTFGSCSSFGTKFCLTHYSVFISEAAEMLQISSGGWRSKISFMNSSVAATAFPCLGASFQKES